MSSNKLKRMPMLNNFEPVAVFCEICQTVEMAREKKLSIIRISGCEKWEIMKNCVNIHKILWLYLGYKRQDDYNLIKVAQD